MKLITKLLTITSLVALYRNSSWVAKAGKERTPFKKKELTNYFQIEMKNFILDFKPLFLTALFYTYVLNFDASHSKMDFQSILFPFEPDVHVQRKGYATTTYN